jgi:hypothetical protein
MVLKLVNGVKLGILTGYLVFDPRPVLLEESNLFRDRIELLL